MQSDPISRALSKFPVATLGHLPTPLEPMPRLSEFCGSASLYIKRDDCTGLAFGGNKIRQLSFYLGDALQSGADTILITGATQSNYVRCAAAASAKLGLECHVQLEDRVPKYDHAYKNSGNVLLDHLFGASVSYYTEGAGEDEAGADRQLDELADRLREEGRSPYVVHLSTGHKPVGGLGYVGAAGEILDQIVEQQLDVDAIVVASGSGHTHAGLVVGLKLADCTIPVKGICVRRAAALQQPRVFGLCREIEGMMGIDPVVDESDVRVDDAFLAPGYGKLNPPTIEALKCAARYEGLVVDPVYTAKSMAGAMSLARATPAGKNILYVHTGGGPGVFGYENDLTELLASGT